MEFASAVSIFFHIDTNLLCMAILLTFDTSDMYAQVLVDVDQVALNLDVSCEEEIGHLMV
jgi:hypothetical protein